MKKCFALLVAALLAALLAVPALAAKGEAYVDRDTLNVYEEMDKSSKVVKKLEGGDKVVIFEEYDDWTGVFYVNKKGDDKVGYVQSKYLSAIMPQRYCQHEWTEWEVYREPTCSKAGLKVRDCPICGVGESKEIKKLSHEYGKWIVRTEATCTEEGERYRECALCGHKETQTLEKLPHEYGKWTVLEEATCTEVGERLRRCMICGYRDVQEIAKLPHEYDDWSVTRPATCTKAGERARECVFCGHVETQALDKLPHPFGRWSVTLEATCTRAGKRVRTCTVCGYEESQSIAKLPHEYKWQVTVKTTDHSAGVRSKVCAVCGQVAEEQSFDPTGTLRRGARGEAVREVQQLLADQGYLKAGGVDGIFGAGLERALIQFQKDQGLNPDGVAWPQTVQRLHHEFGPWEVVAPLTRDMDGEYMRTCRDCGYAEHRTVAAGTGYARRQRGEEIRTLQRMLNDMGYNAGAADGAYGPKLDAAFANFAADNDLTFVSEQLRPSDVDNLVNGWIGAVSGARWKGEGDRNTPVRLVLTVTPRAEEKMEGVTTYDWRLTNLGAQRCRFDALLLSFGEYPDFLADNLALVVGNMELQKDGGNSASGSFSVASDWGEGKLNFCAVGASTANSDVWLSNVRSFGE